jgi:hypothetical protein
VADTSTPPPPDASAPDTAPPRDAAPLPDAAPDAAPPPADASDASAVDAADASVVDAADGAVAACGLAGSRLCNLGETCALDGDCGAPNVCEARVCAAEPAVRTMADIPSLASFDFQGTTLVYTIRTADVYTCTVPGCADGATVPNITQSLASNRAFPVSVADGYIQYPVATAAGSVFTVAESRSLDGATAGPSATVTCTNRLGVPTSPPITASHSGVDGLSGLYKCITDERLGTAFSYNWATIPGATRLDRVGRGSPSKHTNGDATATLVPGAQTIMPPSTTVQSNTNFVSTFGTFLWGRSESRALPLELVTSPKSVGGVDITYPTVALRFANRVEVVRQGVAGNTLSVLAAAATTINIDDTHLYVGQATGLGRCELAEIATMNRCTLSPVSADAVDAPLYLTATHAWYRSGTLVRRALK